MRAKKKFYMSCHLAGRKYHDADEVFDDLHVGTILNLKREHGNPYDPDAIRVIYEDGYGENFVLGYIPQDLNSELAMFLDMGWKKIFECRICKITPEAHFEQQILLSIKILNRKGIEKTESSPAVHKKSGADTQTINPFEEIQK